MAKKKNLADRVNEKRRKAQKSKPVNPFEMHFNKRKTTVLGQNTKQEQGFPGLSRSNAIKKRKQTLLQEYKSQNKANKFIDQRIGERNADLTENDRAIARFVAHRSKEYKKKFVLDDMDTEEVLTHRGQTLNEIEKFDNPNSEDEDDDDYNSMNKSGKLDADFVKGGHFGGGILTKTGVDGAKSHKDLINELISESKKRKAEKQKAKEQTLELTDKLNAQWEDLKPWVSSNVEKKNEKKKADTYDMMIAKLMQEGVHAASDRLKTEDELAKEEKEKLEKLEKDRVARMRGRNLKPAPNHRSADDLDDGFVYNRNFEVMLAYDQDGKCLVDVNKLHKEGNEEEGEESDDGNRKNEEESDDDEVETESEDNYSDLEEEENDSSSEDEERGIKRKREDPEDKTVDKKRKRDKDDKKQENRSNKKEIKVTDNGSDDEIDDAKEEDEDESEEDVSEEKKENEATSEQNKAESEEIEDASEENEAESEEIEDSSEEEKADEDSEEEDGTADQDKIAAKPNHEKNDIVEEENVINENNKQESMDKAKKELPFTFEIPDKYEDFQKFFVDRTIEDHSLIIERMLKCNNPKLSNENKDKMETLFVYLLQYVNDISCDFPVDDCFKILGILLPNLFDLAQMNQNNAPKAIIEVISEKQLDYRQSKKRYPDVDVLFFLKIVSSLFTTSDLRNKVVTPCFVFMEEMLYKCRVKTQGDIAYGLFLVTLVLEYTSLSKRYQPAAISYLAGILHMAIPKQKKMIKVLPPFRSSSSALVLKEEHPLNHSLKLEATDLVATEITEDFKIRALYTSLKLIGEFIENFQKLPSKCEIFEKVEQYLQLIPKEIYPQLIQEEITGLLDLLTRQKSERTLKHLTVLEKPKTLRMYEPKIRPVYDQKRHAKTPEAEMSKLAYKVKKERKGAMREIRKDRRFLAGVQIKERIQSDQQRIKKVKQIYAEASVQQGELKKMERKNNRK